MDKQTTCCSLFGKTASQRKPAVAAIPPLEGLLMKISGTNSLLNTSFKQEFLKPRLQSKLLCPLRVHQARDVKFKNGSSSLSRMQRTWKFKTSRRIVNHRSGSTDNRHKQTNSKNNTQSNQQSGVAHIISGFVH